MPDSDEPEVTRPSEVTRFLPAIRAGDSLASEQLVERVYRELRDLAAQHLRRERMDHTLQPTALVHEAWLRLAGEDCSDWENRDQFLGVASLGMRRVLVDHARARGRDKRGGGAQREQLKTNFAESQGDFDPGVDLLALDAALDELAGHNERAAKVVELRFFGGLSEEEAATTLGISRSTVTLDWRLARAWLGVRIEGTGPQRDG